MTQVSASGGGYDPEVDPGNVNPPAIFEPSTAIIPGSSPQVWVAASGGADWGGCLVSISFDGTNYDYIGTITSAAYQGVLTANLAAASGLDTTDTLAIDLTLSAGILPTAATNADANAFRTLCYICPNFTATAPGNGELLAYGAVAPTGTYTNNLIYLQRGLYGTTGQAFTGGRSGLGLLHPHRSGRAEHAAGFMWELPVPPLRVGEGRRDNPPRAKGEAFQFRVFPTD